MAAHERISAAITAANDEGHTGLVPFITAGYPEPAEFISTLKAVASQGDVVELGIPFSAYETASIGSSVARLETHRTKSFASAA